MKLIYTTLTLLALGSAARADYTVFHVCQDQRVIHTSDGAEAGHVEYVVIDPDSHQLVSTVVTGGVVGEKFVAVPYESMQFGSDQTIVLNNINREQFVSAPVIERTEITTNTRVIAPTVFERTSQHFGVRFNANVNFHEGDRRDPNGNPRDNDRRDFDPNRREGDRRDPNGRPEPAQRPNDERARENDRNRPGHEGDRIQDHRKDPSATPEGAPEHPPGAPHPEGKAPGMKPGAHEAPPPAPEARTAEEAKKPQGHPENPDAPPAGRADAPEKPQPHSRPSTPEGKPAPDVEKPAHPAERPAAEKAETTSEKPQTKTPHKSAKGGDETKRKSDN